jgi:hypothetical protein
MMTTSEKATQKSITLPTRSVHHTNFLWALCHALVRSTIHRSLAQNGAGLPFLEISASSPRSLRRSRVALESYPRSRWTFVPSGNPPRVSATVSRVSGSSGESWRLAGALTHAGEEVGLEAMRSRLKVLASRGLVMGSASGHPTAAGGAEAPLADPWRITEEGHALVEPEAGVARAPYDREVGAEEEGGRDAGFWVLITIAVVTAACAAYSLLTATGVLGGT